ncbi:MAG: hypothetical protein ACK5V3_07035 [Bdellovibrionales bacterium]
MKTTALFFFNTLLRFILTCSFMLICAVDSRAQESDEFEISEEPFRTNPSQDFDPEDIELDTSRISTIESEPVPNKNDLEILEQPKKVSEIEETAIAQDTADSRFRPPSKTFEGNGEEDGLVEVRSNSSIYLPYKERQNRWGWTFSLGAENVDFPSLISQFDDNSFQTLFGSNGQTMPVLELGPKYNFSWGALGLQFGYSILDITNQSLGADNSLRIQRLSGAATLYLDSLFSEGQFIPYGSFGIWQSEYAEETSAAPGEVIEYSTDPGYHARFGALIGLDWLDLDSMYRSRRETGITAIFINVYASTSYMSESSPDPDLENEMDIGASLHFEF